MTAITVTLLLAGALGNAALVQKPAKPEVPAFWIRPGYKVEVAAELPRARFMEFGDDGTLYVSRDSTRDIVAFRDKDRDGFYETQDVFVAGKTQVAGMAFEGGWLWYTQSGAIWKARDTNKDGKSDEDVVVIPEGQLPSGGGHWWRPIAVTADHIYTGIGDASNFSEPGETERQQIFRYNKDGSGKTPWSSGHRNSEKLRMRPGTTELWGVDHGSDDFGRELGESKAKQPVSDTNPPDEFNRYDQGKFYGHPWVPGFGVPRYEYAEKPDLLDIAARTVLPQWNFESHSAANAFTFLAGRKHFPADHTGDAFVATRGSGGRSPKVGCSVERVLFDKETGRPYGQLRIVGCMKDNAFLARPVDCVEAPDGTVLFSDDHGGRIYRIRYVGKK